MRDPSFKRRLRRAEAHQNLAKSPYAKYAQAAKQKFGSSFVFPIVISFISVYSYAHTKIGDTNKYKRYDEHEDIEKQALRWNGTVARWTIVLAIVGVVAAFFNWKTLQAIQGQLDEMKSGSVDAHNLAQAAVDQATAAKTNAKTAQDTFTGNQRAWVGPTDTSLVVGVIGSVISGNVVYVNSGKEPARFEATQAQPIYTEDSWDNGTAVIDINNQKSACLAKTSVNGDRFAWPTSGFTSYFIHFPNGKLPQVGVSAWNADTLNGSSIVTVQGCFTYETLSSIHHTSFCYFYKGRQTDSMHLNICNTGNSAD